MRAHVLEESVFEESVLEEGVLEESVFEESVFEEGVLEEGVMNIILSVPPAIVREVRAFAARNDVSLNQLARDYLAGLVGAAGERNERTDASERFAKRMRAGAKLPY